MKTFLSLFTCLLMFSCTSGQPGGSPDSTQYGAEESGGQDSTMYCAELVKEILKSSARYKQLTSGLADEVKKNGGLSVDIVVDKSPNPKTDSGLEYSSKYELQLTENYPDRQVSFAHFVFDPEKNTLFEYDIVKDRLVPVAFDTQLFKNYGQYCK